MKIDTHAHIFKQGLPLVQGRRYAPDYNAVVADYLQQLDSNGMDYGVLIQPSFLGTNNDFMLEGIAIAQGRLRGIAVIDDSISLQNLQAMADKGIVGIRLNLIGQASPDLNTSAWQQICQHIIALDWHVEVHQLAGESLPVLRALMDSGVKIVIDHFGRPDPKQGVHDPDFIQMLEQLQHYSNSWIKISGAYRCAQDNGERMAQATIPIIQRYLGWDRVLWGSDWPHTQYEDKITYAQTLALFEACVPNLEDQQIIWNNGRMLFHCP